MDQIIAPSIIGGLLGITGTLAGVLVTEYFKRKEKVSLYSEQIFKKKLDAYEKLYLLLQAIYEKADVLFLDEALSSKEKRAVWQPAFLELVSYLEKNSLYINDDIATHCMLSLIAVDDYLGIPSSKKIPKEYYKDKEASFRLIKEDSGIGRIDHFFTTINKPKIKSDIIDYINEIKKKQKKSRKTKSK